MKKAIPIIFWMTIVTAALSAGPLSGRRVPSFALPDSHSTYYDILDYRGKVVLIEMMQTNCPHCLKLAPQIEKVQIR
jgi:thiol-disulfide isomerase/thioredoxin